VKHAGWPGGRPATSPAKKPVLRAKNSQSTETKPIAKTDMLKRERHFAGRERLDGGWERPFAGRERPVAPATRRLAPGERLFGSRERLAGPWIRPAGGRECPVAGQERLPAASERLLAPAERLFAGQTPLPGAYFQSPTEAAEQRPIIAHGATVGNVPPKLIQPRNGAKENSRSFCRPIRGWKLPWPANPRFHRGLLSAAPPALNPGTHFAGIVPIQQVSVAVNKMNNH